MKIAKPIRDYQEFIWKLLLGIGVIGFLFPFVTKTFAGYSAGFISKGLIALICFHPFYVYAHARYHIQLIPIIAILVCCMFWQLKNKEQWNLKEQWKLHFKNISPVLALGYLVTIGYAGLYMIGWTTGSDFFIR